MTALRNLLVGGGRSRRLATGAALGVLLALGTLSRVAAQISEDGPSGVGAGVSGYSITDWLNLLLRLALVIVVIWVAIMAMRWWVRRMNGGLNSGTGHLQVVETRSLGPNRSLQLVRLGDRAVLLGVTTDRISSVLEIDDPQEVERLSRPVVVDDSPASFRDAMSRLGSLTKWRPVIERQRPAAPAAQPVATATAARASQPAAPAMPSTPAAPAPAGRGRWMTLGRRVIGLEDPPPPRRVLGSSAAMAAPRPVAAPGRAPVSMAAASAVAAELPASRAVRARSGYRDNQIAEAQQAIAAVRSGLGR